MIANALLVFCLAALLVLALVTYISNSKKSVNKFLSFFLVSGFLWILFNFLTNITENNEQTLLFARLSLVGASLLPLAFLLFALSFVGGRSPSLKRIMLLSVAPLLIILITPTELNIKNASVESFEPGPVYVALLLLLVSYFGYGLFRLYRFYQKADLQQRAQLGYFFLGFGLTLFPAILANAILPLLGISGAAKLGPASVIFISSFTALAIVKHRLLDVRLIVIRALGYVLTLGILVVGFALVSSLMVQRVLVDQREVVIGTVNAAIFAFGILTYPSIKKYFDQVTNRYFYKDIYDPQEFLDQLNKTIVSNIELGILLRHTTNVIEENLKCSFVQIIIPKTESTEGRVVGTRASDYSEHELNFMRGRLLGLGAKVLAVDELNNDEDELRKIVGKHDISVLVHLSAVSYGQRQTIAYMVFGTKKSGNVYSKQDLKIIEIVADELVIAIQNALRFEEIQEFNVTLQKKVSTATTKLRKNNEKLKVMDSTKDEFISMASHQLRTPLTSVKGYLSMVLEGDAGTINDQQRQLLDQAFVSSQRMVYLIADLLNVSRLHTGKFIIDQHPTDLVELVEGEVGQLREQAVNKKLELIYNPPNDIPHMNVDETKLRQVVMNFIDNAMYYTPAGGRIEIDLKADRNHVYFTVKDNGLGVPKAEQSHLFNKFYRATNARNTRPDGTGLGLFMAKKVITAQGGNVLFESVEGKGSTFGFSLPLKNLRVDSADG